MQLVTHRPADDGSQQRFAELGDLGDRRDAVRMQLVGGDRAHPPQSPHRQRVQEFQLVIRRYQQQPVRFSFLAGDLGEELRAGHPDGDGQTDPFAHVGAQLRADLYRCAGNPEQSADIEKGLVDRERLHDRRAIAKHLEHRVAGLGVGAHARRHHHGVRAHPPRLRAAHRGAHAVGLGFIACRQHDAATDDTGRPRRPGSSRCSTEA